MPEAKKEIIPEDGDPGGQSRNIVVRANYELFVIALAVLQIINSFMLVLIRGGEGKLIPVIISGIVAIFLMGDAFYRIWRWRDRRRVFFHYYGYLLLLGSLPIPFIAILRLLWLQKLLTKLQRSEIANIPNVVIRKRSQSAMLGVLLAAILVLEFSSMFIIRTEAGVEGSNIKTAGDALWWALVTMATVGYGDKYPVTSQGRLIAVVAMSVGVGIFTVLTSFMAEVFTRPRRARNELKRARDDDQPLDVQSNIQTIWELLDEQEQAHQVALREIRTQLNELEQRLILAPRSPTPQKAPTEDAENSDV